MCKPMFFIYFIFPIPLNEKKYANLVNKQTDFNWEKV